MDMYKIIPVVLCLFLVSGIAVAQEQEQPQVPQQPPEDNSILLGSFNSGLIAMNFTPNVNAINTTSEQLVFRLERSGGLSLSGFVLTRVYGTIITPDNETYEIENLSRFAVSFSKDGNYTIVLKWGSELPVIGDRVGKYTGSGIYEITIVKSTEPVNYTLYIIIGAAVLGAIILFLSIRRRRTRVLLQ